MRDILQPFWVSGFLRSFYGGGRSCLILVKAFGFNLMFPRVTSESQRGQTVWEMDG
jgi:hypothetical protein